MNVSIRIKLTLWYGSLFAVGLIIFGTGFVYALNKQSLNSIDEELNGLSNVLIHNVVRPPAALSIPENFDIVLEQFFGVRTTGKFIQFLKPNGEIVARSSNLREFHLPLTDRSIAHLMEGEKYYETIHTLGKWPVRLYSKPVVMKDWGLVAIVQVATSLEGREHFARFMARFLIVGIIFSTGLAFIVASFFASRALKPVDDITKMAKRIEAGNLSERLTSDLPNDEIGRLAQTFNDMIERLENSFRQTRQFTADASHELKTPLTVLKGEIEVALRGGNVEGEHKETLLSLLEEIDRMSMIVTNLLDLAKADLERSGGGPLDKEVELHLVLADRFHQLEKIAQDKGVTLELKEPDSIVVLGDKVRLGQLIYNFIDNAIKYTEKGGTVTVSLLKGTGSDKGMTIFKVTDSGIGISSEDLPHLFDRFYRVDKARSREMGGVGLGLSICKEIITAHKGEVKVDSIEGRGTTFTVKLPLSKKA